jgi:hypothetical protein
MNETRLEKFDAMCKECGCKAIAEVEIYDEKYVSMLKQNFNSLQQLKAEILPLLDDALDEFADNKFNRGEYYLKQAMAKLSAV